MMSSRSRSREPLKDDARQAAALAQRIRDGDVAAETELVTRYRAGLTLLLRKRVKDRAVAEDLCQDVFRIALRALREGQLQEGEKLAGYLWGIARNLASSERRQERRDARAAVTDMLPDQTPGPDQQIMAAERARLVRKAVAHLSARDRAVLTAFYLKGQSKDTVCRSLGLTAAQFDVIKWRALKRLLAALRAREGDDG